MDKTGVIVFQTYFRKIFQQMELYNPRFAHFCHLQNHQNASRLHIWTIGPDQLLSRSVYIFIR